MWPCLQHLESVIRARIPSITSLINKSIDELESEMDHLGRPIALDAGVSSICFLSLYKYKLLSALCIIVILCLRLNFTPYWNFAVHLNGYSRSI